MINQGGMGGRADTSSSRVRKTEHEEMYYACVTLAPLHPHMVISDLMLREDSHEPHQPPESLHMHDLSTPVST